ncbi:S41 family peptidase [Woodsholea maritima]|uniref:S41 family peptidase n=1 Tax=Woodsholea maritima TaxID=240237 RepID=UPI00035D91A2|nr:S41 family peptidase [Woodsholea maritima]
MLISSLFISSLALMGAVQDQADVQDVRATRSAVITELAQDLESNFLFPDAAHQYAAYLRARELSAEDLAMDDASFAQALSAELQHIHQDAHLRVMWEDESAPSPEAGPRQPRQRPASMEAGQWLTPSIAYIRFNAFFGEPAVMAELENFVDTHAGAETLIIDIRGHRGGGLDEMDVLFPELYREPTDLLVMETRRSVDEERGSPIREGRTIVAIDSTPEVVRRKHVVIPSETPRLADTQLYVLTSQYSASAAEHFAMVLQRTQRATLVGEATWGGAHYGGTVDLGDGYAVFIPVGRSFNPDTGADWEGVGVIPDIAVPAEEALVRALSEAGVTQEDAERIDQELAFVVPRRAP